VINDGFYKKHYLAKKYGCPESKKEEEPELEMDNTPASEP